MHLPAHQRTDLQEPILPARRLDAVQDHVAGKEMNMEKIKSHPDYQAGYADGLNNHNPAGKGSVPYEAGWAAGTFARSAFLKAGFVQEDEDTFSIRLGDLT
jgi:hypothetical protein